MATRVWLVRHGETEWNTERRIQGHTDTCLSARGLEQADRVAARLAGEPLAAVYSSDLQRARKTAEAIACRHGITVVTDAGLREAGFGEWEGLNHAELVERFPEAYRLWREDNLRHRPTGGEAIPDLIRRAGAVYDRVAAAHAGQAVAIVGHGGCLRALVAHALGGPLQTYAALRLSNASLSLIEIGKRGAVLALYNDTCYLEL